MLPKPLRNIVDRNILYNFIVHHIYGYCHCLLSLLLFTEYVITVYHYIVLLLLLYRPNILGNMDINYFNWINQ